MPGSKRSVQSYPVRPSHRRNLDPAALAAIAKNHFDTVSVDGAEMVAAHGAIEKLSVRPEGRELRLTVTMRPKVADEVARETIARYNAFLEETTGYTSKERARRLRKSAGE